MLGGRMKLNSDAKTGGGHSLGVTSLAQAQSPWGRGRPWSEVRGGAPGESSGERGTGGGVAIVLVPWGLTEGAETRSAEDRRPLGATQRGSRDPSVWPKAGQWTRENTVVGQLPARQVAHTC